MWVGVISFVEEPKKNDDRRSIKIKWLIFSKVPYMEMMFYELFNQIQYRLSEY